MAQRAYTVELGIVIDGAGSVLSGSGAPGGDGDIQDGASIGSIFLRTDASSTISAVYQKISNAGNASDWVESASKDYVQSLVNGISWREPVLVVDDTTYADIAAAETAANSGDTVDGVTIQAGDRLLFTDLTTGNENVYEVSGSSGNWTFTEVSNGATDGDSVLVQDGTYADQQWIFNGTNWVAFGSSTSLAELGFIRSFIGKDSSGSETPTYSSTTNVTSGNSLEAAIGTLDAALGDRTYTEDNFVTDGEALATSIDSLDQNLQDAFDAIGNQTYTEDNFVTDGESLTQSIDALDQALGDVESLETDEQTGVQAATTVDSVLVDDVQAAKWFVVAFDETNPDEKEAFEVFALNDGTASADATSVDYNVVSKLKTANISGLDEDVVLNGTGATQTMELQVEANSNVTVRVTRIDVA